MNTKITLTIDDAQRLLDLANLIDDVSPSERLARARLERKITERKITNSKEPSDG